MGYSYNGIIWDNEPTWCDKCDLCLKIEGNNGKPQISGSIPAIGDNPIFGPLSLTWMFLETFKECEVIPSHEYPSDYFYTIPRVLPLSLFHSPFSELRVLRASRLSLHPVSGDWCKDGAGTFLPGNHCALGYVWRWFGQGQCWVIWPTFGLVMFGCLWGIFFRQLSFGKYRHIMIICICICIHIYIEIM